MKHNGGIFQQDVAGHDTTPCHKMDLPAKVIHTLKWKIDNAIVCKNDNRVAIHHAPKLKSSSHLLERGKEQLDVIIKLGTPTRRHISKTTVKRTHAG
jgi:hypothetical protein